MSLITRQAYKKGVYSCIVAAQHTITYTLSYELIVEASRTVIPIRKHKLISLVPIVLSRRKYSIKITEK